MKTHKLILIIFCSLAFSSTFAQKGKIKTAEKKYDNYAYIKTSEILLEIAEKGYTSKKVLQKLADSYYFNNKMEDAAKWYGELMALEEPVDDPEYYFRYAQSLKGLENYTESDTWMKKFNETQSGDTRGKAFISNVDYLERINRNSRADLLIENMDINSEFSDFGTNQYQDQLIFASTRGSGKEYSWNEQPFLNLYTVTKQPGGNYTNPITLNDNVNTKYHESTVAFTPDDNFMFFTRNNYFKRKYRKDYKGINRLKMFRARMKDDGQWGEITPVHFNSDDYSVAHPTINVQGTKIYFASDMPGSSGESDIYVANINSDGSLGEPKNLGAYINTEGQETFPYINSKGDLYFSSNGYPGLGGLDVYVVRDFENKLLSSDNNFVVENMGRPINSPHDDFSYYENLGTKQGFFSSNRPGGKGDDDIYSFTVLECEQIVNGVVKDKETLEIIPNATVILFDSNGNEITRKATGADASFAFELGCEKEYLIRGIKETYIPDEKRLTTPVKKQKLELELLLDKDKKEINVGDDLADILDIPIIYFDFDKYNIRYDASVELQKVLAVLNKYPSMEIEIKSHTDSRGTNEYNGILSDNRARSTRQYLIDQGIAPNRLTAKGYGETQLVNHCSNGIKCSDYEHEKNRRSEFIIIRLN